MPIDTHRILFEDDWFLAVTKLSGELVVKGKGKVDRLPLLDYLRKQYPTLHALHRLDFETSGVTVFTKTKGILETVLDTKFMGWKKKYFALVLGTPKRRSGLIELALPSRTDGEKVPATTHYSVDESFIDVSLVACEIESGKRHQIRRHLSMIGHPLILDSLYGNEKANRAFAKFLKMNRFFLHASSVSFTHPVTEKAVFVESSLPMTFERVLKTFREAINVQKKR